MIEKLFQLLSLKCRHQNLTKPFAAAASERYSRNESWQTVSSTAASHYVVCLDCGRKFQYDWQKMRVIRRGA